MNLVGQKGLEDLITDHSSSYVIAFEKINEWNAAILENSWNENKSDEAENLFTCFYALLEDAEIINGPKIDPSWTLKRMRKELVRNWMIVISAIMNSWYSRNDSVNDGISKLTKLRPNHRPTFTGLNMDFYESR